MCRNSNLINIILSGFGGIIIAIWAVGLYEFYPNLNRFFPQCISKYILGIECPSCGAQRAVASILHGNIVESFSLCPFLWITILFVLTYVVLWKLHMTYLHYTLFRLYTLIYFVFFLYKLFFQYKSLI